MAECAEIAQDVARSDGGLELLKKLIVGDTILNRLIAA
jgi:hypothetical protein